jgi:hypothetical protein
VWFFDKIVVTHFEHQIDGTLAFPNPSKASSNWSLAAPSLILRIIGPNSSFGLSTGYPYSRLEPKMIATLSNSQNGQSLADSSKSLAHGAARRLAEEYRLAPCFLEEGNRRPSLSAALESPVRPLLGQKLSIPSPLWFRNADMASDTRVYTVHSSIRDTNVEHKASSYSVKVFALSILMPSFRSSASARVKAICLNSAISISSGISSELSVGLLEASAWYPRACAASPPASICSDKLSDCFQVPVGS